MEKKTYDAVDLFKWLCAWMVMYLHFAPVFTGFPVADQLISQGLCRIAVPFFFATSSLLLFRKMGDPVICARENWKKVLKFCGHILAMYTLWIVIYSCYYTFYNHYNDLPQKTAVDYVLGYFFRGDLRIHLWYLIVSVYAVPIVYLLWRTGRSTLIAVCVVGNLLQCLEWPYRALPMLDLPMLETPVLQTVREEFQLLYLTALRGVPMMCLGILCLMDYKKHSSRQWLVRLLGAVILFAAEVGALYLALGPSLRTDGLIMNVPVIYCLVNWLFTVDFRFPARWMGKVLRINSTWIYCSHILVLMLFHWIFAYDGLLRYVLVGGLTVVSGIPYVLVKLLTERNRKRIGIGQTI